MYMNKNTIELNDFTFDFPKINKEQYFLLKYIFVIIEKNINTNKLYFIKSNIFKDIPFDALVKLLKTNIKLSITDKDNSWYCSDAIHDIKIVEDKIFFRPASILCEIAINPKRSPKHTYLKYILFNQIRYKHTLLFIDYMLKQKDNSFTIEVAELKKVLELEATKYKNFNAFNASVVSRIVADINTKTSYHISYKTTKKKNGKKVICLTFDYFKQDLNDA